jgi:signal transduction histidine kinase
VCTHRFEIGGTVLDAACSTDVFRVLQEALTNVARHAGATRVDLAVTCEDHRFVLELRDNGRGIEAPTPGDPRTIGLVGMRERVARWGGRLDIHTAQGQGTTLRVELPVAEAVS